MNLINNVLNENVNVLVMWGGDCDGGCRIENGISDEIKERIECEEIIEEEGGLEDIINEMECDEEELMLCNEIVKNVEGKEILYVLRGGSEYDMNLVVVFK